MLVEPPWVTYDKEAHHIKFTFAWFAHIDVWKLQVLCSILSTFVPIVWYVVDIQSIYDIERYAIS